MRYMKEVPLLRKSVRLNIVYIPSPFLYFVTEMNWAVYQMKIKRKSKTVKRKSNGKSYLQIPSLQPIYRGKKYLNK